MSRLLRSPRRAFLLAPGVLLLACSGSDSESSDSADAAARAGSSDPETAPALLSPAEALIRDLEAMHQTFRAADLEAYVDFMPELYFEQHPRRKILRTLRKDIGVALDTLRSIELGDPTDLVRDGERLCAMIPMQMDFEYPNGGGLVTHTYTIAVSRDEGRTWKFLVSQGTAEQQTLYRDWFPTLCEEVPFPICTSEPFRAR